MRIEQELNQKFVSLRVELDQEKIQLQQSSSRIEARLSLVLREKEQLELLLQEKTKEAQSWVSRYHSLQEDLNKRYDELCIRFEEYKRANSSFDIEAKFKAERMAYETQIMQLKQRITELDEINKVLSADSKKLAKSNADKFRELDQLRAEYSRLEAEYSRDTHESRTQLDQFKRSSLDVQEITTRHSSEVSLLQGQVRQLEQTNANLKEELKKVYDLLERRKLDDSKNVRTIEELRLQIASQGSQEEDAGSSEYIAELEERLNATEEDRKRLEEMYQKNALELASKNDELIQKIRELDGLKLRYEASLHDLGNVSSRLTVSTVVRRELE